MDFEMNKLAYCGLYCEQCSYRVAFMEQEVRHLEPLPAKYREFRPSLSDYDCEGCKGRSICPACALKDCAISQAIDHCGECGDFPCERIEAFSKDGWRHHAQALENLLRIREVGVEAWFEGLKPELHCHCGKRKSWYCGCLEHS